MTRSACPDPATLAAWIDGRLVGEEHAEVSDHVHDCSVCGWVVSRPSTRESGPRRPVALGIGMTLGRYRIDEELGRGAMGIVYRGYDPRLRRAVAIKVTQPPKGVDAEDYRSRLMKEAEALADADDPCVVRIYDVGRGERGLIYIVMELVEGETATRWSAHHHAPDIVRMMLAVGATLARLHERGLVHGDIKPENLMIEADGKPRLVDFGLARLRRPSADDGPRLRAPGTPGYMAPEQLAGEETQATFAADQYAWATTFFELLSGARPFSARSVQELTERKHTGTPKWSGVPRSLRVRAILRRALAPAPADRWPSMADAIRSRARAWRVGALVGGAGLVAAAIVAVVPSSAPCPVPSLQLDTGLPRLDARLVPWQESWTASMRDSCALDEAERAMARECLSHARLAATAIVDRLSEASATSASPVDVAMVEDLLEPRLCLNARALVTTSAGDPARELELRREVQRAWVEFRNHPDAETAAALESLDQRAVDGGMGPLLARIRTLRGVAEREHGDPEKANVLFEDALELAREYGMDAMVADIWLQRLILEALHRRDPDGVAKTTRFLDAHLEQGLEPKVLAGRRDVALALWHAERNQHELAAQRSAASLAALEDAHNRLYFVEALQAAGIVHAHAGEVDAAMRLLERARTSYQAIFGAGSTKEITLTSNLATLAFLEERWADAERLAREGLRIDAGALPTFEASLHSVLGRTLCHEVKSTEAVDHLRRALELRSERFDVSHQVVTSARFEVAKCLVRPRQGQAAPTEEALTEADALLGRIRAHIDAADLADVFRARVLHLHGRVALALGRPEDALRWCTEARKRLPEERVPEPLPEEIEACIERAQTRASQPVLRPRRPPSNAGG